MCSVSHAIVGVLSSILRTHVVCDCMLPLLHAVSKGMYSPSHIILRMFSFKFLHTCSLKANWFHLACVLNSILCLATV